MSSTVIDDLSSAVDIQPVTDDWTGLILEWPWNAGQAVNNVWVQNRTKTLLHSGARLSISLCAAH